MHRAREHALWDRAAPGYLEPRKLLNRAANAISPTLNNQSALNRNKSLQAIGI